MNTENYTIFDWKGDEYIAGLTKAKAKKLYQKFLDGKDGRIEELQKLLGDEVKLDHSEKSLDYISYYLFKAIKELNPAKNYPPENEREREFIFGSAVPPFFRSLANDISIYIAEMWFIKYPEQLRWELMSSSIQLEGSNYLGITGFPHAVKKYIYAITYYIYASIYHSINGKFQFSDRTLVRQYRGEIPELMKLGLQALPPIPDDLLEKIRLHPEL